MPTDFQDFLKQKTAGSDIRERNRSRMEWQTDLLWLCERVQQWLHEADPEGLIEVVPYEVRRVESRLGIYDAPALKIRLNADEVDVLPIGRYAIGPLAAETMKALRQVAGTDGPITGRVDITDGERKYILLRAGADQSTQWYVGNQHAEVAEFDRAGIEAILQDLWS